MKQESEKYTAEKFLKLESELEIYKSVMAKAADIIIDQDVSSYPIFVAHQQHMEIGLVIAERGKVRGNWNIHASTLEEMVYKQIIEERNIEEFKQVYPDPQVSFCVFVLSELGAQFVFIKR